MPNYRPISKEAQTHKHWQKFNDYIFASQTPTAPIVAAELGQAVRTLPLGFLKQQDNYTLIALMGLDPTQNLYVARDGRWLGGYVPSVFRGYPFRLLRAEGRDELILCVDEDSGLINDDSSGQPIFEDNGVLAPPVKDVMNFLSQVEQNRTVTDLAVSALADAGLITVWPLKVKDGEKEKPVTGLYMVDEGKLNLIDDQTFLHLRKTQALPIAYAQLLSMSNIQIFDKLAKIRAQMDKQAEPEVGFTLGEDDTFRF